MLVVFFGKAGVLADHDGLAGVDKDNRYFEEIRSEPVI